MIGGYDETFFFLELSVLLMIANVRRGDVLVSSSDESDNVLSQRGGRRICLQDLASQLADSPAPRSDVVPLLLSMEHIFRKHLRTGWRLLGGTPRGKEEMIRDLRFLMGFQIVTSCVKAYETRLLWTTLVRCLYVSVKRSFSGLIKAS